MTTETITIRRETQAKLNDLAAESGRSIPDVVDEAVDALRRRRFLKGLSADFAALRSNPEAWEQELSERAEWDFDDHLGDD